MAYRSDQDKIRRQRMLAEMLQQSGMSPMQQQSAGGLPVQISPLQGLNKVAQTALGAYGGYRADKQEQELETERKAGMQDWISQMPTDRNEMMAWALRGEEFGDTGQAVGNSVLSQTLSPQNRNVKVVGDRLYDVDRDQWVDMPEGGTSPASINKVTPSDYTPESIARYAETGDYNVLERYEAGRTVKGSDGLDYTFDPVTRQWYPMAVSPLGGEPAATQEPAKAQTLEDVASSQAQIKARTTEAEAEARNRVEEKANWPKTVEKYRALESQWETVDQSLDKALEKTSRLTTGAPGSLGSYIPGSDARDYYETLQTIKANIGFDRLQQMRDASPTGGALGQVSEMENKLLQSTQGSLEQGQSAEQMRENLMTIKQNLNDLRAAKRQAFLEDQARFGGSETVEASGEAVPLDREDPDSHYDSLPSGTLFIAPDGTTRRKP